MAQSMLHPGSILSMTATVADKLLRASNGDAALLYLFLLRRGGELSFEGVHKSMGWSNDRTQLAYTALGEMGLVDKTQSVTPSNTPPEPDKPPEYLQADVAMLLESDKAFPHLVSEVERQLGKILSPADLKILLTIYDYLGLSGEVILMLLTWCVEDYQRKHGAGQKPRMTYLRKEAFAWHRLGVDTPEAADAHIRALTQSRDRERSLLPLLGISGRTLVEGERSYVNSWVNMGFPDEAIAKAYEITIMKTGKLTWSYLNAILKDWHQKNIHTLEEISKGNSTFRKASAATVNVTPDARKQLVDDMDWMDRFLEKTSQKEE